MPSFLGKEGLLQLRDPGPLPGGAMLGESLQTTCHMVHFCSALPKRHSTLLAGLQHRVEGMERMVLTVGSGNGGCMGCRPSWDHGGRGVPCGLLPQHSFLLQCPSLRALKHQI